MAHGAHGDTQQVLGMHSQQPPPSPTMGTVTGAGTPAIPEPHILKP